MKKRDLRHCSRVMLRAQQIQQYCYSLWKVGGLVVFFPRDFCLKVCFFSFYLSASFSRRKQNKPLWLILRFASWQKPLHYHTAFKIKRKLQFIFGGGEKREAHAGPLPSPSSLRHRPAPTSVTTRGWHRSLRFGEASTVRWCTLTGQKSHVQAERERTASLRYRNRCEKLPWRKGNCWSVLRYTVPRDATAKPEGIQKQMDLSAPTNLKLPDKKLPVITNNIIFMQHSSAWTSSVLTTKRNNKSHKQLPN